MFKYREYQWKIIDEAAEICAKYKFVYLAMQVRTGKTLTSLGLSQLLECRNVLFVTKKKAIPSIQEDYFTLNPTFEICIINYESLHKVSELDFDMIILDEAHTLGAYPKPNYLKNPVPFINESQASLTLGV